MLRPLVMTTPRMNTQNMNTAGDRATPDPEDGDSSSSNSPARADAEESDFFAGNNDSQSSIGGNFQDMAVTQESQEEACLRVVNRLPAEVLIVIFSKLGSSSDLLNCMLVNKKWARNSVDLLWHRPACTTWQKHTLICQTLSVEGQYFAYRDFVKRLNLAQLASGVNDGSVEALRDCNRVERLTLTNCRDITDSGLIMLLTNSIHLLALDISLDEHITDQSMNALADNCSRLQGLNVTGCKRISNESMVRVAENCRHLKRIKLNDCEQMEDATIMKFAANCKNVLEIDLHQCKNIGNDPITELLTQCHSLREFRLAGCELISDMAFLNLNPRQTYENLRILDLTSCVRITDAAVEKIVGAAPRLRNIVFAKCRNLTNRAVYAISKLGKNLHYLHLGHCGHITDEAVINLVENCGRIRYIDLGCCVNLTDNSVKRLAALPKLRRIGLVKCSAITDESVMALAAQHMRPHQMPDGKIIMVPGSSLERVHLSYCTNLTVKSIHALLNRCTKLTHLSLTGVQAFLREDLRPFCREAPGEFTEHQVAVFCVFSGPGVSNLRIHLNQIGLVSARGDPSDTDADGDQAMTPADAVEADADDGDEELEDDGEGGD